MNHATLFARIISYRDVLVGAFLALVSLSLHAIPFVLNSSNPLGYDTGFYRRYLIEPWISIPNPPVPGLGTDALVPRIFLDVLRLTHLSPDVILYGSYLAFFCILPIVLYFLLKTHIGWRGAFFASLFVVLSPIQYNAFWFMFWKNAWALCLLATALLFLDRRWFIPLFAIDIALAFSHKTTAILYIATLGVLFLIDTSRRKHAFIHAVLAFACLMATSSRVLIASASIRPEAIFMDWSTYLGLSTAFLILIFVVLICNPSVFRRTTIPLVMSAFAIAAFLFPIFHIPFYERIFIFCDIAIAVLAGYAFSSLISRVDITNFPLRSILGIAGMCIATGFLAGILFDQVRALKPLFSDAAISSIEEIGARVPRTATILTTSDEAPWFEGWTRSHIAAPGMLHDNHNLQEWMAFWTSTSTKERAAFLSDLPHPLYVATLGDIGDLLGSTTIPCLTRLSPTLFLDECQHDI